MDDAPLGHSTLLYMPGRDVERGLAFYTGVMGADVVFAIEAFGTPHAGGLTGGGAPRAAGRAPGGDAPVLLYRVGDLDTTMAERERRGLRTRRASASRTGHARPSARLAGSGSPSTSSPAPGADARLAGRHYLGPGSS